MADERHRGSRARSSGMRSPARGAGAADPRLGIRALQLRADHADPQPSSSAASTTTSAATAPSEKPEQHYDLEVWADDAVGHAGRARDREGAHPRHVDGRHGRDDRGRQVPRAGAVGRDQLRRRQARLRRAARVQELDRPHQAPGLRQPHPGRADRLAVPVARLHGHARGPGRRRRHPADPPRCQRGPRDDPGLRGDERDGPPRLGHEDHARPRWSSAATRTS